MGQACGRRTPARKVAPAAAYAATGGAGPPHGAQCDAEVRHDEGLVAQQLLPHAFQAASGQEVATRLARRGFSLEQLLKFYLYFSATGDLDEWTTTDEVVRKIVIPQTAQARTSYMESDLMLSLGGPKTATTLVSHAWKNRFVSTVTSIVAHASGLSKDSGYLQRCEFDQILQKSPPEVLAKTYWLCIFAVRQHFAICGDCWTCSKTPEWAQDPARHLAADPCLLCSEPKHNPCTCGTSKLTAADPDYEIDKFDLVVEQMETLLVSLDENLNTVRRVWVCAEVGTAAPRIPVQFVMAAPIQASLLQQRLESNRRLLPPVLDCESSSAEDKRRIVDTIEQRSGGTQAFDELVRLLLELNFGFVQQLTTAPPLARQALARLTYLDMDCTWFSQIEDVADLLGNGDAFRALRLRVLVVNFAGCRRLCRLAALGCALGTQGSLDTLALYLQDSGVDDGCAEVISAAIPSKLQTLTMKLYDTEVTDRGVAAIMAGVPQTMDRSFTLLVGNRNARRMLTAVALRAVAAALPPLLEHDLELAFLHTTIDDGSAALLAGKMPPKLKGSLLLHVPTLGEDAGRALVKGMPVGLKRLRLQLKPQRRGALPPYAALTKLAIARLAPSADIQVVGDPSAAAANDRDANAAEADRKRQGAAFMMFGGGQGSDAGPDGSGSCCGATEEPAGAEREESAAEAAAEEGGGASSDAPSDPESVRQRFGAVFMQCGGGRGGREEEDEGDERSEGGGACGATGSDQAERMAAALRGQLLTLCASVRKAHGAVGSRLLRMLEQAAAAEALLDVLAAQTQTPLQEFAARNGEALGAASLRARCASLGLMPEQPARSVVDKVADGLGGQHLQQLPEDMRSLLDGLLKECDDAADEVRRQSEQLNKAFLAMLMED